MKDNNVLQYMFVVIKDIKEKDDDANTKMNLLHQYLKLDTTTVAMH